MSHAKIEPISGVVRVWKEGLSHGDEFKWSATVRWVDRESVELMGLDALPAIADLRAMMSEARRWGIRRVLIVRYRSGVRHERWLRIREYVRGCQDND